MINSPLRKPSNSPLKIISVNVCRGAQAHEIALNEANQISADVILIQEPHIFSDRSRRITKRHPSYETFSPNEDWTSSRPRVVSYVRKESCLRSEQCHTKLSNDLLFLRLISPLGKHLHIINIYNAPAGSPSSSALYLLYSLSLPFQDSLLLMGDFNLHHTRWQPSWSHSPSAGAEKFAEWIDENGLNLLSPMD